MRKEGRKIKVCQVASADISLKFLLLGFMKYLQKEGFDVQAASSGGKWVPEIEKHGIPVHTVAITRKLFTPVADILALMNLVLFFHRERFDIVHTHTPKASFLGQIAAFLAGVPIRVTTIHGLYFQRGSSWRKKMIFMPLEVVKARIVHRAFSVNTEDVTYMLEKGIYPPEKIMYMGGGVDLTKLDPARFSSEFIQQKRQSVGLKPGDKVVGIVARLVKEKGFLPLFEAFLEVKKQVPEATLLVVGPEEPEKEDALDPKEVSRYGIEKSVIFLGERTDVEELYAVMDVFVLPSFREGLGLSVLEASAMEIPVVASDIRGCREGVEDGVTGFLVPSNNPERLAEALVRVLKNPQEAKSMGKAGRKKVEKEFNEEALFERIEKEYEQLVSERLKS